nr:hypothetical protein [uncultured Cohaesibacter sp.]
MAGVDNWDTTPADNAVKGNVDWSEGMAPAKVNDSARQMMADLAKSFLDRFGALDTTGSAGVYALATNTGITQLKSGLRFTFKANFSSVGGDTLNVDGKGAKKLRVVDDDGERDIVEDEIDAGGFYDVIYDPDANSGAGAWIVQTSDFTAITADIASVQSSLDTHKADTGNPHSVTKAQVGLGNADNTSDADKPISTAQNTAITARLYKASNLSDLPNKVTARTNLDVYSKAEVTATFGNYLPLSGGTVTGQTVMSKLVSSLGLIQNSVGDPSTSTNVDTITHDDGSNTWHVLSDKPRNTDGAEGGSTLKVQNEILQKLLGHSQSLILGLESAGEIYLRPNGGNGGYTTGQVVITPTSFTIGGHTVWHSGNDGGGSGLDADKFQGQYPSYFATAADLTAAINGYESGNLTYAAGSMVSISHGLGHMPKHVEVSFVCTTAQTFWAVGDEVVIGSGIGTTYPSAGVGIGLVKTSTKIEVTIGSGGVAAPTENNGTGSILSPSNFKMKVRAW